LAGRLATGAKTAGEGEQDDRRPQRESSGTGD